MINKVIVSLILLINISLILNGQLNPRPGWKDSYEASGLCWCNSTFDHNLDSKTLTINDNEYSVVDICDELKFHPEYRNEQNEDPVYNDIQCGNGPPNDAGDETPCPGRVDLGPDGCTIIGPTFDMLWLSGRVRFGGFCNIFNCDTISCVSAMKLNNNDTLPEGPFVASSHIESNSIINTNSSVIFQAKDYILLQNKFEAKVTGDFLAKIGSCD